MTPWILASNGRPFTDEQAAQVKRELLRAELGGSIALEVRAHPDGGYAICCPAASNTGESTRLESLAPSGQRRSNRGGPDPISGSSVSNIGVAPAVSKIWPGEPAAYPDEFRVSPASRTLCGHYLLTLMGIGLVFEPHVLFVLLDLRSPLSPSFRTVALSLVMLTGAFIVLLSLGRLVWACVSHTYVIDVAGVQQLRWHPLRPGRLPLIRFEHLRKIELHQSLPQLLLNVGTLRLTAVDPSVAEVTLPRVSTPRRLQAELQRRMQQAFAVDSRAARPGADRQEAGE